jgi:uncharacterized membrane protein
MQRPQPAPQPEEISVQATSESTRQNIETIARLEHEEMQKRRLGERVGDVITGVMGSMTFLTIHLVGFVIWVLINTGQLGMRPFDPFPFGILTLIVSAEGVLLAICVLISQNRMSRIANHRAHLNLQISLLAEQETTKLLQKVQMILDGMRLEETPRDREVQRLSQQTHLETLAEELRKKMPQG